MPPKASRVDSFLQRKAEQGLTESTSSVKISREEDGNTITVTAKSHSIKTVEELLTAANQPLGVLDQDGDTEFVVERQSVRKYDSIFGVRDGKGRRDPVTVPLWYVSVELRRRKLAPVEWEPVKPIIVNVRSKPSAPKPAVGREMQCALILPDMQIGFRRHPLTGKLDPLHDRKAMDIGIQLARILRPEVTVLLGDALDFTEWSDKYVFGPEFAATTQHSAIDFAWYVGQVKQAYSPTDVHLIGGNHEDARMARQIQRNLTAAAGLKPVTDLEGPPLLSIERLLGLDSLGVTYHGNYPHGEYWINDNLRCSHGHLVRSGGGATAKAILAHARHSEITGHLHKIELLMHTTHPRFGIKTYLSFCPGTLSRIDGAVPAATPRVNWQQGIGVVWFYPDNGQFQVVSVPIHDGIAVWNGNILRGEDYVNRLVADTGMTQFA